MTESWEPDFLAAEALQLVYASDSFAAVEFLNQQADMTAVAAAYRALQRRVYWRDKAMSLLVLLSHAGIHYCLDRGETIAAAGNMELALAMRSQAKALAYDLGSFCWPGWAEPGVCLENAHRLAGGDAAQLNVRLALELDKPPLALGRAYWLLGAHLLTGKQHGEALLYFYRAARYAQEAGATAEQTLYMAYTALSSFLEQPGDKQRRTTYRAARHSLSTMEYGQQFLDQLDTASQVASR